MKFTSYLIHNNDGLVLRVSCEGGYISGIIFDEPIMPIEVQKVT